MHRLDEIYTKQPFYGARKMMTILRDEGRRVNRKRVQRLMRLMGMEAVYPKPRLSQPHPEHLKYPYLLRNIAINRADQVWSTDITYIRLLRGFVFLVAIMDWYSRYVLSWEISVTMDTDFCISALRRALHGGQPEIFNSDQGSQFTSHGFTQILKEQGVAISMDGRGRALDNVFVERLWRSVKYEDVYLKGYESVPQVVNGLGEYFRFYNSERPHQALDYRTPEKVYRSGSLRCVARQGAGAR